MDLPIVTGYYVDETKPSANVECTNAIPEFYQVGGVQKKKLREPQGISLFATAGDKPSRGSWAMDEIAYEVAGSVLYRINSDRTNTSLGTILGFGRVSMADNGTQLCIVVPGNVGYIYTVAGGLVQITDTDYTSNPSIQVAFSDGYFLHVTESKFFKSALNDGLDYDGLDFAAAEVLPDKITSIHVSRNQVYIGGVETIEPFQNVGGAGFPYQRVNGGVVPIGVKSKFSLIEFARTFAFIGSSRNELPSVYLFTGSVPEKLATNAIDLIFEDHTDDEQKAIFCTTYAERGGIFLNVHFKNRTMSYDRATGLWHERTSKNASGSQANWRVAGIITAYGKIIVTDNQSGKIGVMDKDVHTEYDDSVKRVFSTIPFESQGKNIAFSEMEVVMESGAPTVPGTIGYEVLFDASAASYDGKSALVGESLDAVELHFKPDGTKVYVSDANNSGGVFQYSLSTPWDISTTSYDGKFTAVFQSNGLFIKPDGSKGYFTKNSTADILQRTLLTPWDISTASSDGVSYNVASEDSEPLGLFFNDDGTKFYMSGDEFDKVHQYSLSTAWDVGTASYDGKSIDTTVESSNKLAGLAFSADGDQVFIIKRVENVVYQYNLSTSWDIGTATYSGFSFSVNAQATTARGVFIGDVDEKLYILDWSSETIYQYSTGVMSIAVTGEIEPKVMRSFSDDGGYTFSNETSRSLGKEGEYKKRQIWYREGQAPDGRMYRFVHDSPTKFAVMGLRANLQ